MSERRQSKVSSGYSVKTEETERQRGGTGEEIPVCIDVELRTSFVYRSVIADSRYSKSETGIHNCSTTEDELLP